jgi:hypothetical protein
MVDHVKLGHDEDLFRPLSELMEGIKQRREEYLKKIDGLIAEMKAVFDDFIVDIKSFYVEAIPDVHLDADAFDQKLEEIGNIGSSNQDSMDQLLKIMRAISIQSQEIHKLKDSYLIEWEKYLFEWQNKAPKQSKEEQDFPDEIEPLGEKSESSQKILILQNDLIRISSDLFRRSFTEDDKPEILFNRDYKQNEIAKILDTVKRISPEKTMEQSRNYILRNLKKEHNSLFINLGRVDYMVGNKMLEVKRGDLVYIYL